MIDRMTAGEESRKLAEVKAERGRRDREMRDILRLCEKAYRTIAGHGPDELDMLLGETMGVADDGSCKITFTVDLTILEPRAVTNPKAQKRAEKEANERKGLFYQSISVFKDAFEDLAPRRKLTPFTLLILGRDGATVKRVDVPAKPKP